MGPPPTVSASPDEYIQHKLQEMCESYQMVRKRLQMAANRQKRYYDMRVKETKFKPGDKVWLWNSRRIQGRKLKWQRCYTGPFTVVTQIGPVNYSIQKSAKSKSFVVHVDKLKLYVDAADSSLDVVRPTNLRSSETPPDDINIDDNSATEQSESSDENVETQQGNGDDLSAPRRRLPPRNKRLPARYRT